MKAESSAAGGKYHGLAKERVFPVSGFAELIEKERKERDE
jgi:hypothetical protein